MRQAVQRRIEQLTGRDLSSARDRIEFWLALRGRELEAIVEGPCDETEHLLEGRIRSQAPEIDGRLLINDTSGRDVRPGEIVRVRISDTHEYDLVGAVIS